MHVLIFRFSAMGDVALTVPVIRGLLNDNSELQITIVTKKFYTPFFSGIDRLHIFSVDFKKRHKGIIGITRLFFDLTRKAEYNLILDLHSVLRTRFISILFKLIGKKVFTISKDRGVKLSYTKNKIEPRLEHTIDRYQRVIFNAGLHSLPMQSPVFSLDKDNSQSINDLLESKNLTDKIRVGIAPFAGHELKKWPINKVIKLIQLLVESEKIHIYLFGGGKEELVQLKKLALEFPACNVVELSLENELVLISKLHVMISMDTGNMHLAALSGVPVISVWGATHPGIGFGPWNQPEENIVQIPKAELDCRPCTVYGKGICRRGDFACMESIMPEMVLGKVLRILKEI